MKILSDIKITDVLALVDRKRLYHGLWQLKGSRQIGERIFREFAANVGRYKFAPQIMYEVFKIGYCDGAVKLSELDPCSRMDDKWLKPLIQQPVEFRLAHEIFKKFTGSKKIGDICTLLAVTAGGDVVKIADRLRLEGRYQEYFLLHGLSAVVAEAATEYGHNKVCEELKIERGESFRISPGYPVWPDVRDQRMIAKLLPLEKIGVSVTETHLLVPEYSTTSIIFRLI